MTDQLEKALQPWGPNPAYILTADKPPDYQTGLVLVRQLLFAEILFRHLQQRPASAIHELRKFTKRVRALLKLVSKALPPGKKRRPIHLLRKLSNDLSAERESDVHFFLFQNLIADCQNPSHRDTRIFAQLQKKTLAHSQSVRQESHIKHEIGYLLDGLRTWVESFSMSDTSNDLLMNELRKSFLKSRKIPKNDDSYALHQWRKRVKMLWYHLRLLQPWLNQTGDSYTSAIDELACTLGDIHDLDTLKCSLVDDDFDAGQTWASAELMSACQCSRDEHLEAAYLQGHDLFDKRPRKFLEMITQSI